MRAGEFAEPILIDSEFDDFGPRPSELVPRPCRLDADGALVVAVADAPVGTVSWRWGQWGPNAGSRCPMIGIWLMPEVRGRGVGSAAQSMLAALLFRHTPVNRIEAHTDVDNVAEQRALERAGFSQEGIVRGAQWRDGRYRDGYLYSILRDEWIRGSG